MHGFHISQKKTGATATIFEKIAPTRLVISHYVADSSPVEWSRQATGAEKVFERTVLV
jgi:hypothetical protein